MPIVTATPEGRFSISNLFFFNPTDENQSIESGWCVDRKSPSGSKSDNCMKFFGKTLSEDSIKNREHLL